MITIGKTKSVCPECMKVVPAIKGIGEDGIYLVKECNAHGKFQTLIWEGNAADYLSWGRENLSAETPVNPKVKEKSCPDNCGLCEEHERKRCCMILEGTKRCNMHCPVCFASAGEDREKGDIPICEIEKQYDFLMAHGGPFNIQLSGGEPTMRDDLPAECLNKKYSDKRPYTVDSHILYRRCTGIHKRLMILIQPCKSHTDNSRKKHQPDSSHTIDI